ncbi:hypothetical protein LP420_05330 [Massilia sp. B-10]|nr:hypothetical protein LP420_05330 [Massilia sp. B-10]
MNIDERTRFHVETALLDCDGSCRDINFAERISTSGAIDVLRVLESSWTLVQAMTGEGEDIAKAELRGNLGQVSGSISTVWNGGSNPEHIQAYFHWDEPDSVFCEITFFPQDLDGATFKLVDFLSMLSKLALAARSAEYYVRYEDASWRHGQHGNDSVILSDRVLSLSST